MIQVRMCKLIFIEQLTKNTLRLYNGHLLFILNSFNQLWLYSLYCKSMFATTDFLQFNLPQNLSTELTKLVKYTLKMATTSLRMEIIQWFKKEYVAL